MRNTKDVDSEDDHVFITRAAIDGEERTRKNGMIYLQDRPVAFSSTEAE